METDARVFHADIILYVLADVLPIYFPFMVHSMLQIPDVSVTVEKIPGGFKAEKGVFEKVA
jgi:hypothetical protein